MIGLWKAFAITLVALFTLAPLASARRKKVLIYYQAPSSNVWYEVRTERTAPPVYTYTVPQSTDSIYVYEAAPPRTTGVVKITAPERESSVWIDGEYAGTAANIMQVALDEGSHDIELRDRRGRSVFTGSVEVIAGQTTEIRPEFRH